MKKLILCDLLNWLLTVFYTERVKNHRLIQTTTQFLRSRRIQFGNEGKEKREKGNWKKMDLSNTAILLVSEQQDDKKQALTTKLSLYRKIWTCNKLKMGFSRIRKGIYGVMWKLLVGVYSCRSDRVSRSDDQRTSRQMPLKPHVVIIL